MTAESRLRWRDWSAGDRLGVGYLLLVIAELVVLGLAWYGLAAIDRQQRTVQNNLEQFATFGAANFAYRAGALVFNHANMVNEDASRTATLGTIDLIARERALTDSLLLCECEAGLRVRALAVLDDSARVLAQSSPDRVVLPQRTVAAMYARIRQFTEAVLTVRMTDETGAPQVIALSRIGTVTGASERFLLTSYDPDGVRAAYQEYIYQSRPPLLPSVYGWRSSNSSVIAIRVLMPGGTVFYESPQAPDAGYSSVPFGPDSLVRIEAALTPDAAVRVRGETVGTYARSSVTLMAVIATLVIALIALVLRRATELARLRGDFTAAVSHELRTPLTEIMLYAELIQTGRTAGALATTDAAQVILAEARRLHNLVENVLVVARTDRRMLRVRVASHDLAPIVRATVATFAPLAAKRQIPVQCELPESLFGRCDPGALAGVLLNLLDNAVRYGPPSQAVIVRGREVGQIQVSIEVDDAGPGIPAADRERVMQPYVRLDRDVDALTSGSGLGLAVARALVDEMHGTVRFDDSTRGGTVATVLLPAR
ncbi:MAG: HAMP domain-containing histidine kinase [Gemmatimonadaceae bacterium]|nr:HAMP domain-containing histidine kinase [Gemmatimonadaceae bacterium]